MEEGNWRTMSTPGQLVMGVVALFVGANGVIYLITRPENLEHTCQQSCTYEHALNLIYAVVPYDWMVGAFIHIAAAVLLLKIAYRGYGIQTAAAKRAKQLAGNSDVTEEAATEMHLGGGTYRFYQLLLRKEDVTPEDVPRLQQYLDKLFLILGVLIFLLVFAFVAAEFLLL